MSLTPRGRSRPADLDILGPDGRHRGDTGSAYGGPMPPDAEPDSARSGAARPPVPGSLAGPQQPRPTGAESRHAPVRGDVRDRLRRRRRSRAGRRRGPGARCSRSSRRRSSAVSGCRSWPRWPGRCVLTHDGEADHVARRSTPAQIPYAFGQVARVRAGAAGHRGQPRRARARTGRPLRPAGPPAARHRAGGARRRAGPRCAGGGVRQLGQQHRAPRAPPGHRLGGVGDGRRPPHRLPPTVRPPEPGCRPRPRSSTPAEPIAASWAGRDGNGGPGDGR